MRTRVLTLNAKRWKILRPYDLLIHRPLIPFPYHFLILSSTLPPTPTSLNLSMNPPYITLVKVLESFWCGISTLGPSLISYASFSRLVVADLLTTNLCCEFPISQAELSRVGHHLISDLTHHANKTQRDPLSFHPLLQILHSSSTLPHPSAC